LAGGGFIFSVLLLYRLVTVTFLFLLLVIFVALLVATLVIRSRSAASPRGSATRETASRPRPKDSASLHRSTLTVVAEVAAIVGTLVAIVALIVR
jgi:hypothetical protein